MPASNNTIFRNNAVQKYIRNREKSVLPRTVTPPVFLLCWLIFTLLVAAGIAVWRGQVPLYITGVGVVLDQNSSVHQANAAVAVILLPANDASHLHAGLPIQLQIGQNGPSLHTTITTVNHTLLSPEQVRQHYGFQVAEPSFVVVASLGPTLPQHLYAGSLVQAQIQIGSASLLSLFPIVNGLLSSK